MIRAEHIREPELEFGGGARHIDVRHGLWNYGPFDATSGPRRVRLGIVGNTTTVDGLLRWMERCSRGIKAKETRQPHLFPPFPGTGPDGPFRCAFTIDDAHQRILPTKRIGELIAEKDSNAAIRGIADAFYAEAEALTTRNMPPDVILCALPLEIIERAVLAATESTIEADDEDEPEAALNLRGVLKARCMRLNKPIQIVWPTTYDNDARIHRKLKKASDRTVQDEATRAWNFFSALYYKAGGLPWRLLRDPKSLRTSYVGISFYRSLDSENLHSSTAQMFDERGEGLILRGGRAVESKDDRRPHLLEEDAYALLKHSLNAYRSEHHHHPARVALHKTSLFDASELTGFRRALEEADVELADFVALGRNPLRLFRRGAYPPVRGTLLSVNEAEALIYTRGSVEFFRTYPGMYVPTPLSMKLQEAGQPPRKIAEEILALTKMNWNNTQFDGRLPITVRAARYVAEILRYVPEGAPIAPRYSAYM